MSAALNSELQPVLTLAADSSAQQRQVDDRVYRMCFYQLELLSKKQRRTRNEWTPLRVFGGRQLAHIAYETASRIVNRTLPHSVIVEYTLNINACLAMLARRHCAIEALSDLRVDVEHYVSALADVDYATNGKRDQDTALSELQKKISSDLFESTVLPDGGNAEEAYAEIKGALPTLAQFDEIMPMGSMTTMSNVYSATYGKTALKLILRIKSNTPTYPLEKPIATVLRPKLCLEYLAFFCTEKSHVYVQSGPYGISLNELFAMQTIYNEKFVVYIAYKLAIVLLKLHSLGVIHRDIRPDSVVWHEENVKFVNVEHAMTCIGNFAKPRSQAKTFYDRTAAEFFNPMEFTSSRFYLAPEIVRKKPFGRASDLWSFGVTMFRLLCGKIPFRGSSKYALDYAIMNEQPIWAEKAVKKISPELKDFVMSLLEKRAHVRLGSKVYSDVLNHQIFITTTGIKKRRTIKLAKRLIEELKCDDPKKPALHEQIELPFEDHKNVESYASRRWRRIIGELDDKTGSFHNLTGESTTGYRSPESDMTETLEVKFEPPTKSWFQRLLNL